MRAISSVQVVSEVILTHEDGTEHRQARVARREACNEPDRRTGSGRYLRSKCLPLEALRAATPGRRWWVGAYVWHELDHEVTALSANGSNKSLWGRSPIRPALLPRSA